MSEELKAENTQEPIEEVNEVVVSANTREEIIARLQEMVSDISLAKRQELESLKQAFYKLQRAAQEEQIAAFVEGGGTAEEFKPEPDPLDEQFRKLMNIIKEKKAAAQEALEIVRKENYKKKLAALDMQKKQNGLSSKDYETQLQELEARYENYMALVGDMAERYALTDYDNLDSIDAQINICIENGELDKADSLIHTVFDPTTVLQRNRDAKAEVAERMRIAQEAIDKALADKEQLQQNIEYAEKLAENCESLAEEYRRQGMEEKAQENLNHAQELRKLIESLR